MTGGNGRERRILDAAASLFGARGPETVTMDEVARVAGVAKGTLYLYFPSKEDMVQTLLRSRLDALVLELERTRSAPGDAWTRLRRAVDLCYRVQVEQADWFRLRRRTDCARPGASALRDAFRELVRPVLRRGDGGPVPDLVVGAIDAAVRRCIESGGPATESEALWRFVRSALGGPPLAGRTVLVTRDEGPEGPLGSALSALGAHVTRVPLLETGPPEDPSEMARETERLSGYDWLLLTSARAARALGPVPEGRAAPRLAVVGEATARAAREQGLHPEVTGADGAADVVERMRRQGGLGGKRVLFPASDRARGETAELLREAGAEVRSVTAYRTIPREGAEGDLRAALAGRPDAICLASASAVEALARIAAGEITDAAPLIAVVGDTTRRAAERLGLARIAEARKPGFSELAAAVADALEQEETR